MSQTELNDNNSILIPPPISELFGGIHFLPFTNRDKDLSSNKFPIAKKEFLNDSKEFVCSTKMEKKNELEDSGYSKGVKELEGDIDTLLQGLAQDMKLLRERSNKIDSLKMKEDKLRLELENTIKEREKIEAADSQLRFEIDLKHELVEKLRESIQQLHEHSLTSNNSEKCMERMPYSMQNSSDLITHTTNETALLSDSGNSSRRSSSHSSSSSLPSADLALYDISSSYTSKESSCDIHSQRNLECNDKNEKAVESNFENGVNVEGKNRISRTIQNMNSSVISKSSDSENRKSFYLPVGDLNLSNATNQSEIMIYDGMDQQALDEVTLCLLRRGFEFSTMTLLYGLQT